MPDNSGFFDLMANSIVMAITYFVNTYSGALQVFIYVLMTATFCFAIVRAYKAIRVLAYHEPADIMKRSTPGDFHGDIKTPLSIIAAGFFVKTKKHYMDEKENNGDSYKVIPPDAFIRDATFQFSERYFEENFLAPLSMTANLMPPQGFIGTIIGMVIHFLSNTGTLNSEVTIAGIATALYTTLIALACYTFLEFLKKMFHSLSQKRIDQGLTVISEGRMNFQPDKDTGVRESEA